MKRSSKKQLLLVLIDFSTNSYRALKYAISLAKTIEGKIILLYVATPDSVGSTHTQLGMKAEAKLKSIVEIIEVEGVAAEFINTVGYIKAKVKEFATLLSPDLIVLGKSELREANTGEIMDYLLYQNEHNLLIIEKEVEFNENTHVSVACNTNTFNSHNPNLLLWLNAKTITPLRIFIDRKERTVFSFSDNTQGQEGLSHKICYKGNKDFSSSLQNHIVNERIGLICIGRQEMPSTTMSKIFSKHNTTQKIIHNTQIPILIMGRTH